VIVADTSLIVAAFASWHELHEPADAELTRKVVLPAHCAVESYSVLTRLPPPHRVPGALVRDFLKDRLTEPYLVLSPGKYRNLIPRLVELGISGGAAYDALIGLTALAAGAELVSCDTRAADTYARIGVAFRLVA
jgi:predicted nucleic acid-binding protein